MTEFALGDPLAIQRWSTSLAVEAAKKQYFSKFIGTSKDSLIVLKNELHKGAGEKITIGLRMKLVEYGIEGDEVIEGHATGEEALSFFNDAVFSAKCMNYDIIFKSTDTDAVLSFVRVIKLDRPGVFE